MVAGMGETSAHASPPEERAALIVGLLDEEQRVRYFGHRSETRATTELAAHITEIDKDALQRKPLSLELLRERDELLAIHQDAGRPHTWWARVWGGVFFVLGWAFLGLGGGAILISVIPGQPGRSGGDWVIQDISSLAGLALIGSGVSLVLATFAGFARNAALVLARRRSLSTLLDWASHRPGQLARGIHVETKPNAYGGGCFRTAVGGCLLGLGGFIAVPLAVGLFLDLVLNSPNQEWMRGGAIALVAALLVAGLGYLILSPRLRKHRLDVHQALMWAYNGHPDPELR